VPRHQAEHDSFAAGLPSMRERMAKARRGRRPRPGRAFTSTNFGAADDLERLGSAKYYFDWVLDEFRPYLRGRVVEVGAGRGTITRKLVDRYPDVSLVALEPAENLFPDLEAWAADVAQISARQQTLETWLGGAGIAAAKVDAAVYLNVLEHIADDAREIALVASALAPGGALLVFGPAHEWLYSDLDHKAGHYRRYDLARLRRLVQDAGMEVVSLRYFDPLGVLPYLVVYRLCRRATISASTLWGYDRLIVPLSRSVQRLVVHPPVGKNVIMVAVKPGP